MDGLQEGEVIEPTKPEEPDDFPEVIDSAKPTAPADPDAQDAPPAIRRPWSHLRLPVLTNLTRDRQDQSQSIGCVA